MSGRSDLTGRPARRSKARLLRDAPAVCILCLRPIDLDLGGNHKWGPTREHVIPVSRGGSPTDPANQALSHRVCNITRGNRTIGEARAQLAAATRQQPSTSRKWL